MAEVIELYDGDAIRLLPDVQPWTLSSPGKVLRVHVPILICYTPQSLRDLFAEIEPLSRTGEVTNMLDILPEFLVATAKAGVGIIKAVSKPTRPGFYCTELCGCTAWRVGHKDSP